MKYIATLRCIYDADDPIRASLIADHVRELAITDLDTTDTCDVTQVTELNTRDIEPSEMVIHLRKSRNMLLRTRIKQCYDMAKELDFIAWALEQRFDGVLEISRNSYSHGDFFQLANAILNDGEDPI